MNSVLVQQSAQKSAQPSGRQLAFQALKAVHKGAFADVALERSLAKHTLTDADRRLLTELVYGCVRRLRSLDALITQLAKKPASGQAPDVRTILHLGLYQLRYLAQIPPSAAVNTTVELLKQNRLSGLSGFVNGLLRQYLRLQEKGDPLALLTADSANPIERLGILHSYPDWIVKTWTDSLGLEAAEQLCITLNQPPTLDLRINPLQTDRETVQAAFATQGIETVALPSPQALRMVGNPGAIPKLPGYQEGWWMVQEASAQLVGHLLNPQSGMVVIDLCAAPGGKTAHLVELMQGQGKVWACDRTASRLKRLQQNLDRLQISAAVNIWQGDGRSLSAEIPLADAVLLDAPCSGLGTLHRHADARWRQTPETVQELCALQSQLLSAAAQHVKPDGILVYATCTLHPQENEAVVERFLAENSHWHIDRPAPEEFLSSLQSDQGWIKIWPHQQNMDGFFMVRLRQGS
ncbi:MAG: 16S rRNA (cytosine(967)-C(5))-methyltransferase [Thermosynechococcaceae cyanobacterium MS004]|nr:16S rRNA (cytosine(967)-C(5))-methyltransferase [Thermosynechococcaceae cyanobacterium MS004]